MSVLCRISIPVFESVIVAGVLVVAAPLVAALVDVLIVVPPAEKSKNKSMQIICISESFHCSHFILTFFWIA